MRVFAAVAVLVSVAAFAQSANERPLPSGAELSQNVDREIVVDFQDGTTKAEFDELEKAWGIDLELNDSVEGPDSAITIAHVPDGLDEAALLETIRANPKVEAAEPMMLMRASYVPNDPLFEKQWNLKMINMPKAWERTKGKGVVVAVIDTGIAYEDYEDFRQVPDLKGVAFKAGYDFVNDSEHPNDDQSHGTHVAGTIAQATNNGEGVAGVAFEATLMPIKVLNHFGSGNTADIADAIRFAADHGAKVINLSLGGGGRSSVMEHAVEYARAHGTVVVCAAGNGGRGLVEYPAAYPGSVAVGAVGPTGTKAPYSSWGKELDLAAPGGDKSQGDEGGIVQNTIDPQDPSKSMYASYQGTSMATPHVAAVAALLWAAGAESVDDVEKALYAGAKPAPGMRGWSEQYGNGILDAEGSLNALKGKREVAATNRTDEVTAFSYGALDWHSFAIAAAMLAFVLLTLGRKERPGYLNVLVSPGFLLPLLVTTMGVFVTRWVAGPTDFTTSLVLPIPDWLNKIIFGRGALANPIVYSAIPAFVLALIAIPMKAIRPAVGGIALGFAGILAYTAWAKAPALAWLPFTFLAMPWLFVNGLICLFIARAMLKRSAS